MTENEAIKDIKRQILEIESDDADITLSTESLKMAIQALEKQIPKKVKGKHISDCIEEREMCGENTLYGNCPNCGDLVSDLWNTANCGDCGQKLDWH